MLFVRVPEASPLLPLQQPDNDQDLTAVFQFLRTAAAIRPFVFFC